VPREKVQGAGSVGQMPRSERERREDLEPTTGRVETSPEVVAPMPAAVLRMQESAGNRATADLLARVPARGSGKPEPIPDNVPYGTMSVEDYGQYQLTSWGIGEKANQLHVFFDAGRDASRFMVATERGMPIKGIWVYAGSRRIELKEVIIESCSVREGITELWLSSNTIKW